MTRFHHQGHDIHSYVVATLLVVYASPTHLVCLRDDFHRQLWRNQHGLPFSSPGKYSRPKNCVLLIQNSSGIDKNEETNSFEIPLASLALELSRMSGKGCAETRPQYCAGGKDTYCGHKLPMQLLKIWFYLVQHVACKVALHLSIWNDIHDRY